MTDCAAGGKGHKEIIQRLGACGELAIKACQHTGVMRVWCRAANIHARCQATALSS